MSVTQADTGSRPGGLGRRVVLLAESAGLAAVLGHLLGPADRLSRLDSLRDLADGRALEGADVVVLDLPDEDRAVAVGHVRRGYAGPLVVLAGEGQGPGAPGLDDACTLVARPFSVEALRAALAGRPWPPPTAAGAAPVPRPAAAAGPGRADLPDRAQRLLVALVEGWRTQRQVRVAGFAVLAVAAFTVAFVLAVQGRCGPGCGQLGTGLSPAPTITSVQSPAASSARARHPTSTTTIRVGPSGTGAFLSTSDRRGAATTAASSRQGTATTTSRQQAVTSSPASSPATSRPATTRPATTQSTAPPTTGPTTTQPPPTTAPTTALGTS